MINCKFTPEALEAMNERGLMEADVSAAANSALENKTYIYSDSENIFRGIVGKMKVYGVFTCGGVGGLVPEDAYEIEIKTAYEHKIVFTEEGI